MAEASLTFGHANAPAICLTEAITFLEMVDEIEVRFVVIPKVFVCVSSDTMYSGCPSLFDGQLLFCVE